MTESGQTPARYRVGLFACAVLGLSILSFLGALDKLAQDHAEEATRQALGAYATVRALNMGVSVLQTAELSPVVGSVQVGQLLDPINDAAERASTALAWSIGSLFVQRILLDFASSSLVKWVFVASGLLALLALLPLASVFGVSGAELDSVRRASVRCFAIAGMLRFLVPVFVASSHLASQALLEEQLNEHKDAVSEMSGSFEILNGSGSVDRETLGQELRDQIAGLREDRADLEGQLGQVNEDFDELSFTFTCRMMRLGCPPEADSLRQERDRLDDEIGAVDRRIREADRDLECIEEDGMSCASFWNTLTAKIQEAREMLANSTEWALELPVRLTNLMISLVVKCIVFPILFLLLASKCGAYVVKRAASLRPHVPAR